jgi:hypothetical protein
MRPASVARRALSKASRPPAPATAVGVGVAAVAFSITWPGLAKGRGLNTFGASLQTGQQFARHTLPQNRAQENGELQ